mgnify:CR=1 FL=1
MEKHPKLQEDTHRRALEQKYAALLQERLDLADTVSHEGDGSFGRADKRGAPDRVCGGGAVGVGRRVWCDS